MNIKTITMWTCLILALIMASDDQNWQAFIAAAFVVNTMRK